MPYRQDKQLISTEAGDRDPMVVNNGDVALLVFTAYEGLTANVFAVSLPCEDW